MIYQLEDTSTQIIEIIILEKKIKEARCVGVKDKLTGIVVSAGTYSTTEDDGLDGVYGIYCAQEEIQFRENIEDFYYYEINAGNLTNHFPRGLVCPGYATINSVKFSEFNPQNSKVKYLKFGCDEFLHKNYGIHGDFHFDSVGLQNHFFQ